MLNRNVPYPESANFIFKSNLSYFSLRSGRAATIQKIFYIDIEIIE